MATTWGERLFLAALLLLIFIVVTACGISLGDPTAVIRYRNLTGERVSVFKSDRREPIAMLAPNEVKKHVTLFVPSKNWRMKVKARDSTGTVVFCRLYSYRELDSLDWAVDIVDGEHSCPFISYRNSTGETITVYSSGFIGPLAVLNPGEVAKRPTHTSGNGALWVRVEASDSAGTLVFCRTYSYDEFEGLDWLVDIVAGENNCPPPGRFKPLR